MRHLIRCLLVVLLAGAAVTADAAELKKLEKQLERIRRGVPGEMAIYVKNLATGEEVALEADRVYETFSVIKVPLMVEVLRQAEAGSFSLADRLPLRAADGRLPSGVLYALDPGLAPTVKDLLTLMIIISDNSATDILADKVGRANVTRTMRQLGLEKTTIEFADLDFDRIWLGWLDPRYRTETAENILQFPFGRYTDAQVREAFRRATYESGIYFGHSTARETGRLFELIAQGKVVSPAACALMLSLLKQQQVDNRFPRYLRDVTVAHKTGDGQPYIANDAGILWVKDTPIVLVVFTGRHRGPTAALHDAIARVAATVVRHYGGSVSDDFKP